ncbi:InlB B-repeat-containing protein, partial [Candidatus Methanomassiliicoccus intestinalis]|uniref:InlB B-repeat-containing protein n=1 Tax=Candidatus Methanomassiliicoccus intestinalis TaxID=1406512 RepID=UPI0037DD4CC2
VSKGTALDDSMPSDPIKEGFDFAGWYVGEEEFTSATIVNGNLTVYAKWTLNEDYVIVYFVIGNELYLTKVCKKDNIAEPNIHNQNKQINGWYVDQELQNKFDFNTVVTTSHLTLYAEWQDNTNLMIYFIFLLFAAMIAAVIASTKRVSFYENKNDEEKYESVLMIGSGAIGDKLPTISNDNFRGWYTEQGEQITEETKITQSMKVYARWKE